MKAISRRKWMLGAAASAAGCTPRMSPARAADTITVLYPYDDTVLGPEMNEPAQFLMFLPLVAWNSRGELEGRLAEFWEHSPDFRTWTVRLRDGIRWHDGVPVTAHDIKFNLDLRSRPDVLWFKPESFEVRVLDQKTFRVTHHRNSSGIFVEDDWTVYYPKHRLENLNPKEFYTWDFWTHPVGNGPYRHVRTVPNTMLHLEANPEYFRGKPAIGNVILKVRGNSGNGATGVELMSGDVDAAIEVSRTDVLNMAHDSRFRVYDQLSDLITVLFWNHRHALFQDRGVRRALRLAINHRELYQVMNFPPDTPIVDGPFSKGQMRRRDFPNPIPYDPELASRLLDEAGWNRRNGQGIRERNGISFSFRVILETQGASAQPEAAVYIQSLFRRIGVRMDLDSRERSTMFQRLASGDYEAAILSLWMGQYMETFPAAAGYRNARHRAIIDRLDTTFDPEDQDRAYADMADVFQQDVPATALFPQVLTTIASKRLHGLDRSPYPGDPTWCMDQLTLETKD